MKISKLLCALVLIWLLCCHDAAPHIQPQTRVPEPTTTLSWSMSGGNSANVSAHTSSVTLTRTLTG